MIEQRSPEWFEQRRGKPTGSQLSKILTSKGVPSRSQDEYAQRLILDRLGFPAPHFDNAAMAVGREREPLAVLAFEIATGIETEEAPFVLNGCGRWGASPDRLIRDETGELVGILEIKCPMERTHQKTMESKRIPPHYFPQVQGQMIASGVESGYFFSYHPDFESVIVPVERDPEWERLFLEEVNLFCDRLDLMEIGANILRSYLKG